MNENYMLDMDEKELSLNELMILLFIQIFFALIYVMNVVDETLKHIIL